MLLRVILEVVFVFHLELELAIVYAKVVLVIVTFSIVLLSI